MQSVVITGASTGIGWATAKPLLDRGFRVFGSVRKQADADRLRGEFGANFTPLLFDVTDEAAVLAAAREVRAALGGETLTGLVNNAGIAVAGPVLELSADQFRRQMDVNVIGSIIATQAFAPLLGSDRSLKGKPGRIVMISSVAGKKRQPADIGLFGFKTRDRGAVGKPAPRDDAVRDRCHHHCSRRGEDADLGQGRRNRHFRLREFAVLPGAGKNGNFTRHFSEIGLPPEKIAERIADALTMASPKVRYQIAPDPMRHLITGLLPKRMVDKIIAKRLGLMPKA